MKEVFFGTLYIGGFFMMFAAYITHAVTSLSTGAYLLFVIGSVLPPVGLIHGILILLGLM